MTIDLAATDVGSAGVAAIAYRAEGAEAVPNTVVGGDRASVVLSAEGTTTLFFSALDRVGNLETEQVVVVRIDATEPDVAYVGNTGDYTVDQRVAITCSASDALSGVASDSCADIAGDAYSFGLGEHQFSATAVDVAGNEGAATTVFSVTVTYPSLQALTKRFVTHAGLSRSLKDKLTQAEAAALAGDAGGANEILNAYVQEVSAQRGKKISDAHASVLITLAVAL